LFPVVAEAVLSWPLEMRQALAAVYHSISAQPFILLAALFLLGEERRAWTFVTAWVAAVIVVLMIFPMAPATGTPPFFIDFLGTFEGARDGSLRTLDSRSLTGIITFPSFHAAAAVLLGWGFYHVPVARFVFVPLNIAMFASALLAGGHYLIDLPAGAAVAVVTILLAKSLHGGAGPRRTAEAA
jgi:hypothetical protein